MKSEDISQKTVRSYLIGSLDEATVDALDELSIADQDFADRIAAEQYDLVDDWVAGRLDPADRSAFGTVLARSPTLVEKVKFAQTMTAAPRVAVIERSSEPGFLARLLGGMPKFAYGFAGLLLILGGAAAISLFVWPGDSVEFTSVVDDSATNVAVASTPYSTIEQTPTPLPVDSRLSANRKMTNPAPEPKPRATRSFVALALSPPTRGAGAISSVKMEPGVEYLHLSVMTEARNSGLLVVELSDPSSGKMAWRSAPVRGRSQKGSTVVSARIPSARLPKGFHTIRLRAQDASADVLDEHLIRIDR